MSIDLTKLTIKSARKSLDKGEFSAVDLVSLYLKNIEEKNPKLNAYLEVFEDSLEQAKKADEEIKQGKGKEKPLLGIPFSIKDNILIEGKIASSASKILENFVAPYNATAIKKLKEAGAIFLGRTNMDEFAMGGSTENSAYGVCRNPYDTERVSGGSSGGSIVSVASDMALASLGSDTGGSVRQPASFCGVVGFKPTYGSVSRNGLMAMGSSLDIIGPTTKTVSDSEIVFNVIKGKDVLDSTSIEVGLDNKSKDGLVIGIPKNLLEMEGIDSEVRENFNKSVEELKKQGFVIKDIELKGGELALAVYYILMPAEVSSNLSRFDGVKYGKKIEGKDLLEDYLKTRGNLLGKEVRRRILLGTYVLSAGYYDSYYGKALLAREVIKKELEENFKSVDLILTPTSPVLPWKIGEHIDPLSDYLADVFTVIANIAGVPAISIPSGKSKTGLPFGIQFMAKHSFESDLFNIGKKFLGEV
jgi:aspartyl-tRNA(Asn)/glutamyl-tRNA(Gln) amidotransferase subunit A